MRPPRLRRPPGGPRKEPGRPPCHPGHGRHRLSPTPVFTAHLATPALGTLRLWGTEEGLRRLDFRGGPDLAPAGERIAPGPPPPHLARAVQALREYLAGERRDFADISLDPGPLTDFQRRVWDRLRAIPFGEIVTYGDVARDLEMGPGASRAVGQAVGANPVAIVIPCHRVVAGDGTLHGFGGGLPRKAALLRLEGLEVEGESPGSRVRPGVLRLEL